VGPRSIPQNARGGGCPCPRNTKKSPLRCPFAFKKDNACAEITLTKLLPLGLQKTRLPKAGISQKIGGQVQAFVLGFVRTLEKQIPLGTKPLHHPHPILVGPVCLGFLAQITPGPRPLRVHNQQGEQQSLVFVQVQLLSQRASLQGYRRQRLRRIQGLEKIQKALVHYLRNGQKGVFIHKKRGFGGKKVKNGKGI